MKRLAIVALSLVTALTSVPPAMALPTIAVPKIEVAEAQTVQYRRYRGGYNRDTGAAIEATAGIDTTTVTTIGLIAKALRRLGRSRDF